MKRLRWTTRWLPAGGLLLLLVCRAVLPVQAQSELYVSINPIETSVPVGGTTTFTVDVTDGVDLYGYDLTITYDASAAALDSWSHGSYLSNIAVVKKVEQPGLLRLVVTQLGVAAVSGDGTLLKLVFRGVAPGSIEVAFNEVALVNADSEMLYPAYSNALLTVTLGELPTSTHTTVPASTFTPSPTGTHTPTFTATSSLTNTATPPVASVKTATPTRTPTIRTTMTPIRAIVVTRTMAVLGGGGTTPVPTGEPAIGGIRTEPAVLQPGAVNTALPGTQPAGGMFAGLEPTMISQTEGIAPVEPGLTGTREELPGRHMEASTRSILMLGTGILLLLVVALIVAWRLIKQE